MDRLSRRDRARHFSRRVVIESGRVRRMRRIGSVREAAQYLLEGWPHERRGTAYSEALSACVTVLSGADNPEIARDAFIAAAKEVGIFVREGP